MNTITIPTLTKCVQIQGLPYSLPNSLPWVAGQGSTLKKHEEWEFPMD